MSFKHPFRVSGDAVEAFVGKPFGISGEDISGVVFNFSALAVGARTNPLGSTFTRASTAYIENGDNALISTAAAINEARIAQVGSDVGLRIEGAMTNLLYPTYGTQDATGWSAGISGTSTPTSTTDMFGATRNVLLHNANSGGVAQYPTKGSLTNPSLYAFSFAHKQGSTSSIQNSNFSSVQNILLATATASWARSKKNIPTLSTSISAAPCDGRDMTASGGQAAQARNYYTDLHQLEQRPASTYHPSARSAERIQYPGTTIVVGGKIQRISYFKPAFSAVELETWYTAGLQGNVYFWYLDANNYACIIIGGANHRKVKVCVAGISEVLATALPDWAAWDKLKIYHSSGNGVPTGWYEHNGGARTTLGTGSTVMDPIIPGGANIDFFSAGGSTGHLEGLILSA